MRTYSKLSHYVLTKLLMHLSKHSHVMLRDRDYWVLQPGRHNLNVSVVTYIGVINRGMFIFVKEPIPELMRVPNGA